jgi:peptidoglycan/xylan/chitin deacetylase (PgdA/CDA1 family)
MEVAPLIADVLNKPAGAVTFFAANERTKTGDGSLGDHWAPWWKARADEGHEFASHTWDHTYWRADLPAAMAGQPQRFRVRASAGPRPGKTLNDGRNSTASRSQRAATGCRRSPAGSRCRCSARRAARHRPGSWRPPRSCGYAHVGWAPAGFLGDELPSEQIQQ